MALSRAAIRSRIADRRRPVAEEQTGQPRISNRRSSAQRRARLSLVAFYTRSASIAVLVLLVTLIVAFQLVERDQVRAGVHALGVDLGGMTQAEARDALHRAAEARISEPLVLKDGEREWTVAASDLGLTIDVDVVTDDALAMGRDGFGPDRLALLWHLRNEATEIGVRGIGVRSDLLDAVVQQIAADVRQEKIDPSLTIDPAGGVNFVSAQVGRDLNIEETRAALVGALANGQSELTLSIDETQPVAYDEDYAAAREQLGHIWDATIEVVAADETWSMTPDVISSRLSLVPPANGEPASLTIDETWVDAVVWEISLATDRSPQSPRIWWGAGGNLVKTADGSPGKDLDEKQSWQMIRDVFLGVNPANRLELPVKTADPQSLPADLNELGIRTMVAEASTPYGESLPAKKHNIELAAQRLNGVVILPGQTFSFNAEIGRTTIEAGFQMGYGIAEGDNGELQTVPSEAGGICQVATTVFQPVFWAGYQIDVRSTHSYWIPSYAYNGTVGLDATVDEARGLDFKWTNNSPTAVLIEAVTDGQNFTVRLYGTPPPWQVEIAPAEITNTVPASDEPVYQASDTIPDGTTLRIERANDGFDVRIVRRVVEGEETRQDEFEASYGPSRNVILVGSSTGELPAQYQGQ